MEAELIRDKNGYTPSPTWPIRSSVFFMVQITLRLLAVVFTAVAISLMVSSRQSVFFFGIEFTAKFNYASAFRFKVGTDAVTCAFSLFSLILVYMLNHPKTKPSNYFYLLLHDMVMMVLVVAGNAAATAIGYVGRYGQDESGWIAICDRVGKFCEKVLLSVVFSYLAFFSLFALSIMAAYKLKIHAAE